MKKFIFIISVLLLTPAILLAQSNQGINNAFSNVSNIASSTGFKEKRIDNMIGDVISLALSALGILFVVFIVYGGFLWFTAAGSEEKVNKAKKILFEAVLGLIIVLGAYLITSFIINSSKSLKEERPNKPDDYINFNTFSSSRSLS